MADYQEGQTATNPKTGQTVVYRGGQWVAAPMPPGAPVVAPKMSAQEQKALNDQRTGAQAAMEAKLRTSEVIPALQRLHPGAWRGAFLDAAIPQQGGGMLDKLGAWVIGGPARMTGYISDQDVKDYQRVMRAASLSTRQSETGEKGTQTEGDAARALLATLTPSSSGYKDIAGDINSKADRQIARAQFYSQWATRYGLNGVDEQKRGVEQAFQDQYNHVTAPSIRRVK